MNLIQVPHGAVKLRLPDDPEKAMGRLLEEMLKAATKGNGKPSG
jgi:hypothetical protein